MGHKTNPKGKSSLKNLISFENFMHILHSLLYFSCLILSNISCLCCSLRNNDNISDGGIRT